MSIGNNVGFIGRLVADPELKVISDTFSVANFTLARDRYSKDKDKQEADFVDFVATNKSAEFLVKYFKKGSKVGVQGEIRVRPYTDKDGNKRKSFEVYVSNFEFVDSKGSSSDSDSTIDTKPTESEDTGDDSLPF